MAYWVLKAVLTPIFFVLFRVKVEGRENIPKHGPAVLAANHQSFCDSFFIPLVVTRRVTFLAKAEYFDSWKTAWFFRAAGQIPIRRGGGSASDRALETARNDVLGKGRLLGLYPEGTRTLDQYVHKGRTGVTRLSRECGVPVIPVGVIGTVEVQPVNSKFMRPFKTVTIRFGAPMQMDPPANPADPLENHDHTQCRDFTDRLMHEIARLSEREYIDEYVPSRRRTRPLPERNPLARGRFVSILKQPVHIDRLTSLAWPAMSCGSRCPDRPGALGLVASRIGAVGGDIVAINILERDGGQAVDEFVVEIGGHHLIELLRSEIHEVDGVSVLEIRAADSTTPAG